jgi:hypothetical protein
MLILLSEQGPFSKQMGRHAQLARGRKEARALFNHERAGRKEIQDDTSVDNNDSQNQSRTHPNNHNPMEKRRRKRE